MKELICIMCPKGCHLTVDEENGYAVTGNDCPRGIPYGQNELKDPRRVLTSTVKISGGLHRRLPIKSSTEVPKPLLGKIMKELDKVELTVPVSAGDVLIPNILGTGADIVASRSMK